jgi:hypothetical protein
VRRTALQFIHWRATRECKFFIDGNLRFRSRSTRISHQICQIPLHWGGFAVLKLATFEIRWCTEATTLQFAPRALQFIHWRAMCESKLSIEPIDGNLRFGSRSAKNIASDLSNSVALWWIRGVEMGEFCGLGRSPGALQFICWTTLRHATCENKFLSMEICDSGLALQEYRIRFVKFHYIGVDSLC